jgi:hypothetical protein
MVVMKKRNLEAAGNTNGSLIWRECEALFSQKESIGMKSLSDDELLKAKAFVSGKWRRSKAVRAETGSDGSKANNLLDERTGGTLGGGGGSPARAPSGTATSVLEGAAWYIHSGAA